MKQNTIETQVITITIPVSDHKALVVLAARKERSMAAQVRFAIRMMLNTSEVQVPEMPFSAPEDDVPPF